MKNPQYLGPAIALGGVVASFTVGVLFDVHVAAWVLAAVLVFYALLRILLPRAKEYGIAVRSLPTDLIVLLPGVAVLIFLAQTAPDLY